MKVYQEDEYIAYNKDLANNLQKLWEKVTGRSATKNSSPRAFHKVLESIRGVWQAICFNYLFWIYDSSLELSFLFLVGFSSRTPEG